MSDLLQAHSKAQALDPFGSPADRQSVILARQVGASGPGGRPGGFHQTFKVKGPWPTPEPSAVIAAKPQLSSPFGVFLGPWWRKRGQVSFRHAVSCEFVLEEYKVSGLKVGFPDVYWAGGRQTVRKPGHLPSLKGSKCALARELDYITMPSGRDSRWLLSGKYPLFRPFML